VKTLIALALALFAVSASAQTYGTTALLGAGTNNVASESTNSYGTAINLTRRDTVGLQFSFKCSGTNEITGGTATLVFSRSVDGTTYGTASTLRFSLAATSTNTACLVTNLSVGMMGYLKLVSLENTTTNALTNLSVIYSVR
tara:strand:+ start:316 stop:741 length:426 start_codon:yes stop_codon:yes gene_type:complete